MAFKFNPFTGTLDFVNAGSSVTDGTTAGQMCFWNGSTWTYTETSELFWDDTNKRVGIGTSTPGYLLDVNGDINMEDSSAFRIGGDAFIQWSTADVSMSIGKSTGSLAYRNLFLGYSSGSTSSGEDVMAFGNWSARYNTGDNCLFVGNFAGQSNTAEAIVAIGKNSGTSNTGIRGTFVGQTTGKDNTGVSVTAIGFNAGISNTGNYLTAVGSTAGYQNVGTSNVFMGYNAGYNNTEGYCTGLGFRSLDTNTGDRSTSVGCFGGYLNTGDYLVSFGERAGYQNTGDNCVLIGYRAGENNATDNQFILKHTDSNATPLMQGNFSTGNLGIGTASPNSKLQVDGSISKPIATKTADYTLGSDDYTIVLDASSNTVTASLPSISGIEGRLYNLKCIDSTYTVTVDADGTETIDGELAQTLGQWDNMKIQAYSGGWLIL